MSYAEIGLLTGVPKSTLSGWLRGVPLSKTARARLTRRAGHGKAALITRNKMQTVRAFERAEYSRTRGRAFLGENRALDPLVIGAVLYWAEGYKRLKYIDGKERASHTISFVNADPDMVRVFIRFLRNSLGISEERIRLTMRLYPHIHEGKARSYWTRAAGLVKPNFFATTYAVSALSKHIRPRNRLPYGTLHIEVCDTEKFHFLLGLIEGVKDSAGRATMAGKPG